jgi:hypothetical protein
MGRIILFVVAFYIICLAMLDTVAYNGRYRQAVWNQANYQVNRAYYEVSVVLNRMGITTTAVARP